MSNLEKWENIIKEKRKKTPFREFIKEIASWFPIMFYKNDGLISRYPNTNRANISSLGIFEENRDNLVGNESEKNILTNNFLKSYQEIFSTIPHPAILHYGNNENCDFTDTANNIKNSYLSFAITRGSENIVYSFMVRENSRNVLNSVYVVNNSENIYFCRGIISSFQVFYSNYINNSNNIWFSSNLSGCSECIFCNDLDNCSYFIDNVEYEKKDFFKKKEIILKEKINFSEYYSDVDKKGKNTNSINVIGNFITESENVENGNVVTNIKDGRNIFFAGSKDGGKKWYDFFIGGAGTNDIYGVASSGNGSQNIYCSSSIGTSFSIYYSYHLEFCSFCLGCIGLKNKSFCILNQQYTKGEWYENVDKIFSQMNDGGILGDFFPGYLNPFYFNDTMSYLIDDSFTKEEVEKDGYMWREEKIKVDIPENTEIIETKDLNKYQRFDKNGDWKINSEILKKVIKDEKGNVYRIVQMEYDFLIKYGLPLPEIHWLDRIKLGFKFN